MHDHHFHDSNGFNKAFDPYFGYPRLFNRPNFDNMPLPFGPPSIQNKYPAKFQPTINIMGDDKAPVAKFDNSHTESSDTKKNNDKAVDAVNNDIKTPSNVDKQKSEEPKDKSKQPDEIPPKTNEIQNNNSAIGEDKKNVTLNANKDYILVDNNGNNAYLLHESIPNNVLSNEQPNLNNAMYVPVTSNKNVEHQPNNQYYQYPNGQPVLNQPNGNNVMYVPLVSNTNNPQQPSNQIYQVLNGQPTSMNIPFTGNGINPNGYNNVLTNTPQSNPLPNNYNPSYIYIYANGQLTQIPAFIINPQQNLPIQNGYNGVFTPSVPNYGVQNGYNPISIQLPAPNSPVSNNIQPSGIAPQNLQPNNNLGLYNVQNGYSQSNIFPNYNNAGAINNPGVQSNTAYPTYSNGNNNQQPSPQKEENAAGSPQNDVSTQYDSPKTSQVVPVAPAETKNYIGVQPAIMFSDFKDKDDSKEIDEGHHEEDVKEKKKAEA
ncbi:unnamed protein product [Arctia plantaginis]|uniref:Uncharacterized protein n=1 Tax=Arctia plantaginis TaxID=874455 RepID=A0A8S1AJC6_ARCPL|nr:unnamed protein product [Arctia plantaginis]